MRNIMKSKTYNEKAEYFLKNETQFRLGIIPTEQSNPKTKKLSGIIKKDTAKGIAMLQSVDRDVAASAEKIIKGIQFKKLVSDILAAINNRRRIFVSGCGATGRLAILLEAAWRKFWQNSKAVNPDIIAKAGDLENMVVSIMTGGDRALVRAVENFEDIQAFGKYQIAQEGILKDDVLIAITEGGETSSVIGTVWQALDSSAKVFFVFNNPADVLAANVERSRQVIQDSRVVVLDLYCGPMAISGSTRMQATTSELLIVGSAMEIALCEYLKSKLSSAEIKKMNIQEHGQGDYVLKFKSLLDQLELVENVNSLSKLCEYEKQIYTCEGLVTYYAVEFLLDIFTDTTERSPTFTIPPFRKIYDKISKPSWSFVKNPELNTKQSWNEVFRREPNGLTWNKETYKKLDAPQFIINNSPSLDNDEIYKYVIGNEDDFSRYGQNSGAIMVCIGLDNRKFEQTATKISKYDDQIAAKYGYCKTLAIGQIKSKDKYDFPVRIDLQDGPLELWTHLAIKLVLNTISTATMCLMNRVLGNWMICAAASNKKLIDRGIRIVSEFTGLDYDSACHEFHESQKMLTAVTDFVPISAYTIYRLLAKDPQLNASVNMQELLAKLEDLIRNKSRN
jgi:N-acetylmuramic acid 6-phosphate etherase